MNIFTLNVLNLERFYLLPKIHKILVNVPGRPAISNNNRATENVSAYLDQHLKSLVPNIPHILEDIRDFLCRINEIDNIPDNAILVSSDVVELYPNIPQEEGIKTIHEYLESRSDKSVSTKSICELESIILKNNFFQKMGSLSIMRNKEQLLGQNLLPRTLTYLWLG